MAWLVGRTVCPFRLLFLILSGLATGAFWLCYYYAIQKGTVSAVVPIDKMSILVSIAFSTLCFMKSSAKKAAIGLALMICGTFAMAVWGYHTARG